MIFLLQYISCIYFIEWEQKSKHEVYCFSNSVDCCPMKKVLPSSDVNPDAAIPAQLSSGAYRLFIQITQLNGKINLGSGSN